MDILRFSLSGKTAFFKKPDLNTYLSYSFGNIHKVALLGLFGSILGYKGYANSKKNNENFPEFYIKLHNIQCSIIPRVNFGYINKKVQLFNNSVGYASTHKQRNLIVKEQWLENPCWDIFVKIDSEISIRLANAIINHKCVYIPYLGKNDHPADITNASIINEYLRRNLSDSYIVIDSLFLKNKAKFADSEDYDEYLDIKIFKYEESLPVGLDENTQMYYYETFINTNLPLEKYDDDVYEIDGKTIVFF